MNSCPRSFPDYLCPQEAGDETVEISKHLLRTGLANRNMLSLPGVQGAGKSGAADGYLGLGRKMGLGSRNERKDVSARLLGGCDLPVWLTACSQKQDVSREEVTVDVE